MNQKYIYLTSILVLMMAATVAVPAQELNALENNAILNNTTSNAEVNITTQNSTPANVTYPENTIAESALNNASLDAASNDSTINQIAQNLSTVNDNPLVAVPISEIAKTAPEVAAGASSAQAATKLEDAYKLGSGVGGLDPFNPKHKEIESLEVGLPIKPMRDTSKLFFVCDIV